MKGYMGRVLRVDLTAHTSVIESLDEDLIAAYIGGTGLASRILYTEVNPAVDPLGPENKLVFAVGPLNGTPVPMSGRHVVVAKSPLTGLWGEGDAGGFWGYGLKRAGFDAVIVEGAAETPVYLWISEDGAEIRTAEDLWGMDTVEADAALKEQLGRRVQVCSIGPAGEHLIRFATIMNDGGRAVGRGGLGAVMGSKKLKAIAVAGSRRVDVAHPEMLKEIRQEMLGTLKESEGAQALSTYGTGANLEYMLQIGNLPLKNWAGDQWAVESAQAISSARIPKESFKRTKAGCYGCPIGCEKVVRAGAGSAEEESGPEYETVAAFGSLLLNDDWESIVRVNHICNRYGMDTIEAGTTLAMATECFERGLLDERTLGFSLNWGDAENIVRAVEMMARREGFGDVLARGVRGAAAEIGGEAPTLAMHVKGSSLCMHDPRIRPEMGLKYATLPMGAYHGKGCPMESTVVPEAVKVAQAVVDRQNFSEVTDCLVMCSFAFAQFAGGVSREYIPRFLQAVTGREWGMGDLNQVGERIFTLKRAFIAQLGVTEADDKLPQRFEKIPRVRFDQAHTAAVVGEALPEYYKLRGWQADGTPNPERLEALDI